MDSHSVSKGTEEASGSNSNGESESRLSRDPDLYDAAAKGNVEPFKDKAKHEIERLVTVTNNTILHINIIAKEPSTKFAEEILAICPSLLFQVNARGDTPLHVAAKCGCVDIVKVLIEKVKSQHDDEDDLESGTVGANRLKQMIGMLNNEKNTALHEAVCCCNVDIVKILVKELPEFPYSANCYGETPLYMAAAGPSDQIVYEILKSCPSATLEGPFGKTVLHAAVMSFLSSDVIKQLIEREPSLIRETDQHGWTPLHYAAYFGPKVCTKVLLKYDRSAANIVDKDRKMTPLLLAAARGKASIVDLIISSCPECCELVDDRDWNVVHFAMLSFNAKKLESFLKNPFVINLINEKDVSGNTPLHLLAAFCGHRTRRIVPSSIPAHFSAVNKQNRSVGQVMHRGSPELKEEIEELCKGDDKELYPNGFIKIIENKWKSTTTTMKTKFMEDHRISSYMDSDMYEAAAQGKVEPFKFMEKDVIERLVTVTKNTILHINIIAEESSTEFAEKILVICPSLLFQVNARGDTPLHVAAKCGRVDIVEVLIEKVKSQHDGEDDLESGTVGANRLKQMIGMLNNEKNTALHEAVCCRNVYIVNILVKELPEFPYSTNCYGETPLYMAVARSSDQIVDEILENCPSTAHGGPFGKTVLHAAVMSLFSEDKLKQIVERKKSLIRDRDQHGWTPLHYTAYFNRSHGTKLLLEFDRSAANIPDKDRKMTPLHLAVAQENAKIVVLIISSCPECCELVDDRGWNVLHFAMLTFNAQQLIYFVTNPFVRNLINEKDVSGNTPLHLLAAFCRLRTYDIFTPEKHDFCDFSAVNKQNRSVQQIKHHGSPELKQEIEELSKGVDNELYPNGFIKIIEDKWKTKWKLTDDYVRSDNIKETQMVVAALVATVTFTAEFTLPGGYRDEEGPRQGTAILSRNSAFQAFVITNTIAMVLSVSAVFIHLIMSLQVFNQFFVLFVYAYLFIVVAIIAMVIAFITGTYAMLSPSLGLVIPTCFIGLSFFLLVFYLLYMALWVKVTKDIEQAEWAKWAEYGKLFGLM